MNGSNEMVTKDGIEQTMKMIEYQKALEQQETLISVSFQVGQ